MDKVDKVIRDGKVAVIYSPGWGAGWSSWNNKNGMFDPKIVAWIEGGKNGEPPRDSTEGRYVGGLHSAEIEWIPVGTLFRIDEYDGYESIIEFDVDDYTVA